jgi:NADPH:quinone reductase-like Zn-dependent oxidoreductase
MDLGQRNGVYPVPPQGRKNLGVEFAGVIETLHSNDEAEGFKPGDEVLGLAYGGKL